MLDRYRDRSILLCMETTAQQSTAAKPSTVLDEIVDFMERFMVFSDPNHAPILALWVAHTYAFDAAYATPYLYVTSPEKQSGKTLLIDILSNLARNPVIAGSVSASSLYRIIEGGMPGEGSEGDDDDLIVRGKPTLFIDEVDTIFTGSANEDLRGVLNTGYKANGTVLRTIDGQVQRLSTFAPKLLAGIDNGAMPDTIADRCIRIVLKRKKKDQTVERFLQRRIDADAADLRQRIADWVRVNMDQIAQCEPPVIDEISDRAFEIAEPLLQIASRAKGWSKPARACLTEVLKPEDKPLSVQAQILLAARNLMVETGMDRVSSAALAEAMNMHPKRIGSLLAPYGIKPTTVRFGKGPNQVVAKGYHAADFDDAWSRYL